MKIKDTFHRYLKNMSECLPLSGGVKKLPISGVMLLILLTFSLAIQCVYIVNYFGKYHSAVLELQPGAELNPLEAAEKGASAFLKDTELWSDIILTPDIYEYSTGYMNLTDSSEYERHRKKVEDYVNLLDPPPYLIERFYVLGNDKNHKSFMKEIRAQSLNDNVPDADVLRQLNLWDKLNSYPDYLFFIPKGEFTDELSRNRGKVSFGEYAAASDLFNQLEGNIVVFKTIRVGTRLAHLLCVINPEFYNHYFSTVVSDKNYGITLFDSIGNTVWSSFDESRSKTNAAYKYTEFPLQPQHYKMVFRQQERSFSQYGARTFLLCALILILSCAFTAFVGKLLFRRVMRSYENISSRFKEQSRQTDCVTADDFSEINHHSGHFFDNRSLRVRVFIVFLVAVLIPQVVSGFMYSYVLYTQLRDNMYNDMLLTSRQINFNLENNFELCSLFAMRIETPKIRKYITESRNPYILSEGRRSAMDEIFAAQTTQAYLFDGIVILAPDGLSLYQSIYPDKPFQVSPVTIKERYEKSTKDVFFLYNVKDILGRSSNSIVRKIYNDDKELIGYLQIYLKNDIFALSKEKYPFDLVVANSEPMYNDSKYDIDYSIFNSNQSEELLKSNKGGTSLLMAFKRSSRLNWGSVIVQNTDYLFYKSQMLLLNNAAIILLMLLVIIFVSWKISQIIARPVVQMKNRITDCENGHSHIESMPDYGRNDEIGELTNTYNSLISKINTLMEENAKRRLKEMELSKLMTEAELNILQQQINPHFLYNTLESISMDASQGGESRAAGKMAMLLSRLFRYACDSSAIVTLGEEIMHTQNYIEIQKMRFPEKFTINWMVSEDAKECIVTKFILQPIIENCITHGLSEYTSGGKILVEAKIVNDNLVIEVGDNGVGMRSDVLQKLQENLADPHYPPETREGGQAKHGIGCKNVRDRIILRYGESAVFDVESKFMSGTKVTIIIPASE